MVVNALDFRFEECYWTIGLSRQGLWLGKCSKGSSRANMFVLRVGLGCKGLGLVIFTAPSPPPLPPGRGDWDEGFRFKGSKGP